MKTVVLDQETNIVTYNNVDISKYYGTILKSSKTNKGFIISDEYIGVSNSNTNYIFKLMCKNSFTRGNSFGNFKGRSLTEIIKSILSSGSFDVFEFDTPEEIFEWLSK